MLSKQAKIFARRFIAIRDLATMSIYGHAREHHIQNRSETENKAEPETTTSRTQREEKIAPPETPTTSTVESAESSTPLCDTYGRVPKRQLEDKSEHTSCPATVPTEINSAKAYLPVGESLFGLVIVTPFLLYFIKRKI